MRSISSRQSLWLNAVEYVKTTSLARMGGLKTQMQSRFKKRASKTGIGKNIAGTVPKGESLANFTLGMESQRWHIILLWKNVIV